MSRLEEHNLDTSVEDEVICKLEQMAPTAKGIVVSDFVYGVVTPRILKVVQRLAEQHNLLFLATCNAALRWGPSPDSRAFRCYAQMKEKRV